MKFVMVWVYIENLENFEGLFCYVVGGLLLLLLLYFILTLTDWFFVSPLFLATNSASLLWYVTFSVGCCESEKFLHENPLSLTFFKLCTQHEWKLTSVSKCDCIWYELNIFEKSFLGISFFIHKTLKYVT